MPTYDYECEKCGHRFELFQRITADAIEMCPVDQCPDSVGDGPVKRLIGGGAALLFKGDGFYITDYRSESYKKAEKADRDSRDKESGKKASDSSGSSSGGGDD